MSELATFCREVAAWFRENRPPDPDFLLPESFMEVGSDAQFEYLRTWQRKGGTARDRLKEAWNEIAT